MRQEIQGRASVIRGLICVLLLVGLLASMASAQSLNDDSWSWLTEDSSAYLSGEIIIQFSYNELAVNVTGPRTRVSLFNEACETILSGSRIKRMLGQIVTDLAVVELPRHTSVQQAITRFSGKTGIRYAEPQYLIHATYTPNDVLFGDQWNLDNQGLTGGLPGADINAPEGWDINREAADIIVAVLDSG